MGGRWISSREEIFGPLGMRDTCYKPSEEFKALRTDGAA